MKRLIISVLALSALAPLSAQAQERLSDANFIAASRCLAYADVPQLSADGDFAALREAARVGYRNQDIASQARDDARRTRVTARSLAAREGGLDELRTRRNAACESFVQTGLVQLSGAAPRS